jgi:hypothetical protein
MHPSGLDISSPRRPKKDIIDKTCPNSSDIEIARNFLFSIGAQFDFKISGYRRGIEKVVNWMQVNSCCTPVQKKLTLKSEAEKH